MDIRTDANPDLPASVRRLVEAVRGFLNNDDGCDDGYIMAMMECIAEIEHDEAASEDVLLHG